MEGLESLLASRGLDRLSAALAAAARPGIVFRTTPRASAVAEPAVRGSRVGGLPARGREAWPTWKGSPLAFLAQFDLAQIAEVDPRGPLPRAGTLQFFYDPSQRAWGFDPADRGSWRVRLVPADEEPREVAEPPADLPAEGLLPACELAFLRGRHLPTDDADLDRLNLSSHENEAYWELIEELGRANEPPLHWLLGHPDPVQGSSMSLECQLASNGVYCGTPEGFTGSRARSLRSGAADWRLLLQLDTDENANMCWGDLGRLYFWIRSEALARGDFANVWMILQCT